MYLGRVRSWRSTRVSFEALERYVALRWPDDLRFVPHRTPRLATDGHIARLIGVSCEKVRWWRRAGVCTLGNAERAADALGVHPSAIWGEYLGLASMWHPSAPDGCIGCGKDERPHSSHGRCNACAACRNRTRRTVAP